MKTALILISIWAITPAFPVVAAGRLSSSLEAVPFVGCRSDGQLGPRPAPEGMRNAPVLKPPIAGQLAFYAGQELGVLAPRGWSCFELYGSNGSALIVTPEPHGKDLFKPQQGIETDAVELAYRFGGTSGRFAVASIGARFFPMTRSLVQRVREESVVPIEPVTLTSADRVTSRTASRVTFVTAGDAQGLRHAGIFGPSRTPCRRSLLPDVRAGTGPDQSECSPSAVGEEPVGGYPAGGRSEPRRPPSWAMARWELITQCELPLSSWR